MREPKTLKPRKTNKRREVTTKQRDSNEILSQTTSLTKQQISRRKGNHQASGIRIVNHRRRTPRIIHHAKSAGEPIPESVELETRTSATDAARKDTMPSSAPTHPIMEILQPKPRIQTLKPMLCKLNWKGHQSAKDDWRHPNRKPKFMHTPKEMQRQEHQTL